MEKLSQKWSLVTLLEPVEEGAVFPWDGFPLHVTFAAVFAVNWNSSTMLEELAELLKDQESFTVDADVGADWGEDGNLHVMQLKKTPEIMDLHKKIVHRILEVGGVFNEPQYINDGLIPHVTDQKHAKLALGETVTVNEITIVDMFPGGDGYKRKILGTVKLLSK